MGFYERQEELRAKSQRLATQECLSPTHNMFLISSSEVQLSFTVEERPVGLEGWRAGGSVVRLSGFCSSNPMLVRAV